MLWMVLTAMGAEPTLPVLEDPSPPVYPASAFEEGLEASVVLRLQVDSDGRVAAAEVAEGAGLGFDEAALEASFGLVFTPATDAEGNPATAVILYRYVFSLDDGLDVAVEGDGYEITVEGRRVTEVTERILQVEDIRVLPGTNGDVVRVVQNLPGVARPPLNVGQLIIRGVDPEDSAYYLDGGRIPIVFHFAGLSTVINGDSLDEVAYLPGSYSVRYGRQLGGLVDLRTDSALPERWRSYASVDVFQATAFTEARVGKNTSLTFSGRRSYIDAVLNPLLNGGALSIQAPRYYDFQARVLHEDARGIWDVFLVVSDDRFRVLGEGESVAIGLVTSFQKLRLQRIAQYGDWRSETTLIGGPENQSFVFEGAGEAYERPLLVNLRQELTNDAWKFGIDAQAGTDAYLYDVFGPTEEGRTGLAIPGLYAEYRAESGPLQVTSGVRADFLFSKAGAIAPPPDARVSVRYTLTEQTALKAGTGKHNQFPRTRELLYDDLTEDLRSEWAIQSSVGVEQKLGPITADLTGFYHHMDDLVSGREDAFRFFSGPPPVGPFDTDPYANDGVGRSFGVELGARLAAPTTIGLLSFTASRSLRRDRPEDSFELFAFDQPFVLNALVSQELPRNWRLGSRFRMSSGNPYTPVVNRFYDLESRTFFPIYGDRDSARLPLFFSLDVRIDKVWEFRKWSLTTYLDIQNATNQTNPEVIGWTYDYSEEDPVASTPVLPAFGLKGEW